MTEFTDAAVFFGVRIFGFLQIIRRIRISAMNHSCRFDTPRNLVCASALPEHTSFIGRKEAIHEKQEDFSHHYGPDDAPLCMSGQRSCGSSSR